MKRIALFALAVACSSAAAGTVFITPGPFHTAAPGATLIEDFEDSNPAQREVLLLSYTGPGNEITFAGLQGTPIPNVFLASPGHTNFGAGVNPTTSVILTGNGNDEFIATLSGPVSALGFDVFLNDQPLIIQFFNGATLLTTVTINPPVASNPTFVGLTSATGITSFHWTATNGENINTGIDNIYAEFLVAAGVPEPSTWALMLLGFGAIGVALRRQRRALAAA